MPICVHKMNLHFHTFSWSLQFSHIFLNNILAGLDPAGPLFESQDPRARLDQTDADFVDVIHSNGENLILGGLGSSQPMGHVDFYPNGGRMQKGCSHLFVGAVSDIIWCKYTFKYVIRIFRVCMSLKNIARIVFARMRLLLPASVLV